VIWNLFVSKTNNKIMNAKHHLQFDLPLKWSETIVLQTIRKGSN